MNISRVIVAPLGVLLMCAVLFSACGVGNDTSREDAQDANGGHVDKSVPHVTAFNNTFANIEDKCDSSGHRIFETSNQKGNRLVILPDPTCPGYQAQGQPVVILSTGQ